MQPAVVASEVVSPDQPSTSASTSLPAIQSTAAAAQVVSPDQPSTSAETISGWAELISLPTRHRAYSDEGKQKKQRKRLPSFRLTSPEHYSFLSEKQSARNKSCKAKKGESKTSVKSKSASCRKRQRCTECRSEESKEGKTESKTYSSW